MTPAGRRLLVAILSGAAAGYGVLAINASGLLPGIHGDSVEYLAAAESFRREGALEVPRAHWSDADSVSALSHFPPGFPVLISLGLGGDSSSHASALWVMAASAALAMAFLTLLVAEAFGSLVAVVTALALLTAPVWVRLHMAVWSEPSYMAVSAALLYAMVRRPDGAWVHGLLAAAGVAIRYVGVAGALAATAWAWRMPASRGTRLQRAALAGAPSALFLLWWQRRVATDGGAVREAGVYGDLERSLAQAPRMLTEWAVPGGREGAGWLAALLVVVGLAVVLVTARRGVWRGETRRALLHAALVYGGCYTLVVVASRLFADPRILFDARMLMPVLVLATVLFVASAGELAREGGVRGWVIFGLATVVWLGAAVREDRAMVAAVNERGMYFTFVPWAVEPAVIWLEEASAAFEVVYSNEPALVHFLAGRHAKDLPVAGEDLASFERAFRAAPGAVVVFDPLQPSHLPADVFVRALGLHTVVRGSMGVVLAPAG